MSFNEFKNERENPPQYLTEQTLKRVESDFSPAFSMTLIKLAGVHGLGAIVTLSVCPQFGFRFFPSGPNLFDVFMYFGHTICTVLCGAFFIGISLGLAKILLSLAEWHQLKKHGIPVFTFLIGLSLLGLYGLGAQINLLHFHTWLWVLGAGIVYLATVKSALFFLLTHKS